jgi:hypothetical protein
MKAFKPTITAKLDSATTIELAAKNEGRSGISFYNTSTSTLYIAAGDSAAVFSGTPNYTVALAQGDYWEPPAGIEPHCAFQGIWSSAVGGHCLVTEYK